MWSDLLRSVAAWPMWSRRRAGVVAGVVVAVLWAASLAGGGSRETPAAAVIPTPTASAVTVPTSPTSPTPSTSAASPGASTSSPAPSAAPVTGPTAAVAASVSEEVTRAAEEAVTAWARPSLSSSRWRAALKPLVTGRYARQLATVDPSRVPATRVTGPAVVVTVAGMEVLADVSTDAGPMHVRVRHQRGRWLVDSIWPAQTAAPAPTGAQPADD